MDNVLVQILLSVVFISMSFFYIPFFNDRKSNKKGFPEYKFTPIPPKFEYNRITPIQCKSCGAQVKHIKCDYCGNEYPENNNIIRKNRYGVRISYPPAKQISNYDFSKLLEDSGSAYIIIDASSEILINKP